jgi:hypothetical protein
LLLSLISLSIVIALPTNAIVILVAFSSERLPLLFAKTFKEHKREITIAVSVVGRAITIPRETLKRSHFCR